MSHLREIAQSGVAVLCTIHQPSQRIFSLSDKLLLLSQGKVAYFGPTRDVIAYFQRAGCMVPLSTSIPEWLLHELNSDFQESSDLVQKVLSFWESSPERAVLEQDVYALNDLFSKSKPSVSHHDSRYFSCRYQRTFAAQVAINAQRNLTDALRNPGVIYLRTVLYLALALTIGIGWSRIPFEASRTTSYVAVLHFTSALMVFMSAAVLPVLLSEKLVVTRERFNGSYCLGAYLIGRFLVECIYLGTLSIASTSLIYNLVGLNPMWSRACFFAFALFASLILAESLMILVAAVVSSLVLCLSICAVIFGAFLVVQGFLVPFKYIPWPLRWVAYAGLYTYIFSAYCINEFSGRSYSASSNSFPQFNTEISGETVLQGLAFPLMNKWANIAVLFAMCAAYRGVAYLWILKFHTGKRKWQ